MAVLRALQVLAGHSDRVWCVAWSPSGEQLATCSGDKTLRIWSRKGPDTSATSAAHNLAATSPGTGTWICTAVLEDAHTRTVRCCSWSPNGRHLAAASFDATTAIWELQGGIWEQVATLEGHENEVKCVAWSPDGGLVATCGRDRSVWVWESLPGNEYECVDVKHGHSQDVKMVAWHPSGELLASASYDDSIKLWASDGDEWSCVQTLGGAGEGHTSTVWAVAFDPSGARLASCSDDCTVRFWACSSGASGRGTWRAKEVIVGLHSRAIFTLDWSKDGLLATGDGSNTIMVFTEQPSPAEAGVPANDMPVTSTSSAASAAAAAAMSTAGSVVTKISMTPCPADVDMPDSQHAEKSSNDPAASASTPAPLEESSEHLARFRQSAVLSTEEFSAGGVVGQQGLWRLLTSQVHASSQDVNCVRWHPKEPGLLASAGDDGLVRVWRLQAQEHGV